MAQNRSYFNFTDNVAIVTDGSTRIGFAVFLLFARATSNEIVSSPAAVQGFADGSSELEGHKNDDTTKVQ